MKLTALKDEVAKDEKGFLVTIKDKAGEPYPAADGSPATMTVLGAESKAVRKVEARQTRRVIRRQDTEPDEQTILANRAERCAAAVVAWHGFEDDDGNATECTTENVKTILLNVPHILNQVQNAVDGPARFFVAKSDD